MAYHGHEPECTCDQDRARQIESAEHWRRNCFAWKEKSDETERECERLRSERDSAEARASAAEQQVADLEARLQFDPSGSDKIDELEQAIQFLRHELDVARTELGLKRSDCVRLGMDCDALNSEKRAAEQRVKRLEYAARLALETIEAHKPTYGSNGSLDCAVAIKRLSAALAASDEGAEIADTKPVCATCGDTHRMSLGEREALCTRCPLPCSRCGAPGPYCKTTPCDCECHKRNEVSRG